MGYKNISDISDISEMKLYAATIGEFNFFTQGKSPAQAKANLNYRYFMKTGQWVGVNNIELIEISKALSAQIDGYFFNHGDGQMEMAFGEKNEFLRFAERGTVEISLKEAAI